MPATQCTPRLANAARLGKNMPTHQSLCIDSQNYIPRDIKSMDCSWSQKGGGHHIHSTGKAMGDGHDGT